MKPINIKQHILPIYLFIVIMIQLDLNIKNILLAGIPLFIISTSIHFKNKKIGIIGLFLFYILSLLPIGITSMEEYLPVALEIFFIILPSIFLLGQILQLDNNRFIFSLQKKPLITSIAILVLIMTLFYLLTIFLWDGYLLSKENIEAQVLTLSALSLVFCLPLLLIQKLKTSFIT